MKSSLKIKNNMASFKTKAQGFQDLIQDEIFATTEDIATKAIQDVPVDKGMLKNSINTQVTELKGVVEVMSEYAPYIEFGTGTKVDVGNYADYANEFKGRNHGSMAEFEQSLRDWIKSKGIEESALYPIMMSILRLGIAPQPFLFPNFEVETNKMLDRLKKKIDGVK